MVTLSILDSTTCMPVSNNTPESGMFNVSVSLALHGAINNVDAVTEPSRNVTVPSEAPPAIIYPLSLDLPLIKTAPPVADEVVVAVLTSEPVILMDISASLLYAIVKHDISKDTCECSTCSCGCTNITCNSGC